MFSILESILALNSSNFSQSSKPQLSAIDKARLVELDNFDIAQRTGEKVFSQTVVLVLFVMLAHFQQRVFKFVLVDSRQFKLF